MKIISKQKLQLLKVAMFTVLVTGCTSKPDDVVVMQSDPAIMELIAVAKDIAAHEKRLYQMESARYLEAGGNKIGGFDMSFIPSLDQYHQLGDEWSGPIEPLLEKISEIANLRPVRYLNVKPSNPIIVYVNTDSRRLIDVLADAGGQARSRAKVTLKMRENLIQIEYNPQG